MWKKVLLASAAIAIVGSTIVYAQRYGGPGGPGRMRGVDRFQPSAEDMGAFADARVAAMKAGLRLNADQEKNWPAYEAAYRNLAKLRADRMMAMRDGAQQPPPGDMLERLQRRAEAMSSRAAAIKQVSDATAPLYRSLDDGQKRRFAMLSRILSPKHGMHRGGPGRRGPGDMRRDGFAPGQMQRGGLDGPGSVSRAGPMERIRFSDQPFDRPFESYGADNSAPAVPDAEQR